MPKKKKSKKKKSSRRKAKNQVIPLSFMDYYGRAFYILMAQLHAENYEQPSPHSIRKIYFGSVMIGIHEGEAARTILSNYSTIVQDRVEQIISARSIAYWLHLSRRIGLAAPFENKDPITVGYCRAILDVAIQKFGQTRLCGGVRPSDSIPESEILGGILVKNKLDRELEYLRSKPGLVLHRFSTTNLQEFYDLESLIFEVWRISAHTRGVTKGCSLFVVPCDPYVGVVNTPDGAKLIKQFDKRNFDYGNDAFSSTGVVRTDQLTSGATIVVPQYNITGEVPPKFKFDSSKPKITLAGLTKFLPSHLDLQSFLENHQYLNTDFTKKHGVNLESVVCLLLGLYLLCASVREDESAFIARLLERGYEGVFEKKRLLKDLISNGDKLRGLLEISQSTPIDFNETFELLTCSETVRKRIGLICPGPHSVILPVTKNRAIIDFAWIHRVLYFFFADLKVRDSGFKGFLLEKYVQTRPMPLPPSELHSSNFGSRQVDASFAIGKHLFIVECRAVGWSLGMETGDVRAIRFRNEVVKKALSDIDEKADWLKQNPSGTNYSILKFNLIVPLACTPFVEYIPSLDKFFWLANGIPRVLSPRELSELPRMDITKLHHINIRTIE